MYPNFLSFHYFHPLDSQLNILKSLGCVNVICVIFQQTINNVQRQCFETTTKINDKLKKRFLAQDVMDVLGLVNSQYWLKHSCEQTFPLHIAILKGFYS
jgi:hypothetical protein